ncbi:MAG: DNA repair exonuclease SbcCD ATPase subunit [Cyclobacteriaceae bacterium]|jgi:DNA repair exonuclease SbcCD ATPase subunit
MTTAILEILALLIVSCAIGIFFTHRYWKARFQDLLNAYEEQNNEIESLQKQLSTLENERTDLKMALVDAKAKPQEESKKKPAPVKKASDDRTLKKEIKDLKEQLSLHEQSMSEKEREIEVLSAELSAKKISYYKQIDGKRYKAVTLLKADESVAGKGDGRISKQDAEEIFATISDGKAYTQVEKDTMRYLRDNYNWTEGADELFRTKVRSWAAKGHDLED